MVALNIEIEPYQKNDKEFIDSILRSRSGMELPSFIFDEEDILLNGKRFPSVYLAKANGKVAGFCSIWLNHYHPFTLYFLIHVQQSFRKKGIGTMMFDLIKEINISKLFLQTSIWSTNLSGHKFLCKNGFAIIRRTIEPTLNITLIEKILKSKNNYALPEGFQMISLSELERAKYFNFVTLTKKYYECTHTANPVGEISLDQWENVLEAIADGSYLVIKDNNVIAFALLNHINATTKFLGWRCVAPSYSGYEKDIILALTYKQLEFAFRLQQLILTAEIDDTDKWSSIMLHNFPFDYSSEWVTYQLK